MSTPKAQTLQQRFGFQDKDLVTPKHDEIMLWLDENIIEIVNSLEWLKNDILNQWDNAEAEAEKNDGKKELDLFLKNNLDKPLPDFEIKITNKIWEHPVHQKKQYSDDKGFLIGFIDFFVNIEIPRLYIDSREKCWKIYKENRSISFEVKTQIPSLGELFRQIQTYRSYLHSRYCVVCPDSRFEKQINDQGIYFLKYPFDDNFNQPKKQNEQISLF